MKKKQCTICKRILGEAYFNREVKKVTIKGRVCRACRVEKSRQRRILEAEKRKDVLLVEYDTVDYELHNKYRAIWKPTYIPTPEELGIDDE